jgi:hypothetical protein
MKPFFTPVQSSRFESLKMRIFMKKGQNRQKDIARLLREKKAALPAKVKKGKKK